MREMILRGLQQAYENMVHMIAEFLPRIVVMFIIMSVGWLLALLLNHMAGLRFGRHQRSWHPCPARADFASFRSPARNLCCHSDSFRRSAGRKLPFSGCFARRGKCRLSDAAIVERNRSLRDLDSGGHHGSGTDWIGQGNGNRRLFDIFWRPDVGAGGLLWHWRTRPCPAGTRKTSRRQTSAGKRERRGTDAFIEHQPLYTALYNSRSAGCVAGPPHLLTLRRI